MQDESQICFVKIILNILSFEYLRVRCVGLPTQYSRIMTQAVLLLMMNININNPGKAYPFAVIQGFQTYKSLLGSHSYKF